ncbi:MAG: hypothetical protein CR988_05770 [Treponema sp.]|nr:MAG: hypothetical protein CR988_05770 [Treponema sp.]
MKNKWINFSIIAGCLIIMVFSSCSPVAEVAIAESGDVVLDLTVIPSGTTEALVERLADKDASKLSIYDKNELINSLKKEDITVKKLELISSTGIKTKVLIPKETVAKSELFLIDTQNRYITCNINKQTLGYLIEAFPEDIKAYIEDLLMSPIITGEVLTSKEYENLIAAAYGPKIAGELKTAFLKIAVSCPGKIDSVKIEPAGKVRYFTGNSTTITVPLSYILSLPKPLLVKIEYK